MGCGASKSGEVANDKKDEKKEDEKKEEEGGETTGEDASMEDSVVKNHPPKPAQRLEEQPQTILRATDLAVPELPPTISATAEGEESEAATTEEQS